MNHREHKTESVKMLQAFILYTEEGIKAVKSMFPQYLDFVDQHKQKSVKEVKNELMNSVHA
jgi:hypothetical protein